ncbi:hypothetical protein OG21DRAFT_1384269, partial [Imleria badia]
PCCAVAHCTNPLESTRHHFCSTTHCHLEFTCAVDGCDRPVAQSPQIVHKACDDALHQRLQKLHLE